MSISVVINTKNAAQSLEKTLKSVEFADEIIVVDMESTDQTKDIAAKFTNNIYSYPDAGYVEPARKFAVSKAQYDWVLIIDADETISNSLAEKIKELVEVKNEIVGYYLARKNIIWQKWIQHTNWWPDYQLRLFKKDKIKFSDQIHQPPATDGATEYLPIEEEFALVHDNYQTVDQYLARLQRYTTHEAKNIKLKQLSSLDVLKKFTEDFLNRYFVAKGHQDGVRGTALSLGQASYQLFSLLKSWEQIAFKEQINQEKEILDFWKNFKRDLAYYIADWQVKNSFGLEKVFWQFRRKFKL